MEIRASKRQVYREPYAAIKFINVFHFAAFKNRNAKGASDVKSAIIVFMNEDDQISDVDDVLSIGPWDNKFKKNRYLYKQKKRPDFSEAVFISNILMERVKNKTFDEVYIGFRSHKGNHKEFVLCQISPVNSTLSFLIPKYIESIIFGILLEVFERN